MKQPTSTDIVEMEAFKTDEPAVKAEEVCVKHCVLDMVDSDHKHIFKSDQRAEWHKIVEVFKRDEGRLPMKETVDALLELQAESKAELLERIKIFIWEHRTADNGEIVFVKFKLEDLESLHTKEENDKSIK